MHGLTLKYEWHDDDVLSLIVQVANGVFSGAAQLYSSPDGPADWAKEIGRGPHELGASCEVSLGNFNPTYADGGVKMRLEPMDQQGHIACTVTLQDGHAGTGKLESVTAVFLTEPTLVDAFVASLSDFKTEYDQEAVLRMAI